VAIAGQLVARRYLLEKEIGAGGAGVVWLATDRKLKRPVALKRAKVDSDSTRAQRRTRREALLAAQVVHPHVITLLDVEFDKVKRKGGNEITCWLVMEHLQARTLAQILAELGPLPTPRAVHIATQIASALGAMHAKNVVHGDIKPGNVLVTDDDDVKVIDFGASHTVESDATDLTITQTGVIDGTPAYAAPEVANGHRASPASDVFGLGATLYAALIGTSPYGAEGNAHAMLHKARIYRPPVDSGELPLAGLAKLLQPEPGKRPSAAQARMLLRHAGDTRSPELPPDQEVPREPPEIPPVGPASAPRGRNHPARPWWRRPLPLTASAAALAAALAIGLVVWNPLSGGDSAPEADEQPQDPPQPVTTGVGEPRTADPCSLLDPDLFADFGEPVLDPDYGNFDRCDVVVELPEDGSEVDVMVDLNSAPFPEDEIGAVERTGSVGVARYPDEEGGCERWLLLNDGAWAIVSAEYDEEQTVDLCAMADIAADDVADVLNEVGQVPRREGTFPADSLAQQRACSLLDPQALSDAALSIDPTDLDPGFGEWDCDGGSDEAGTWLDFGFDRPQFLNSEDDGQLTQIAGYDAAVEPEVDGDGTCAVRLEYREYTSQEGDPATENLQLLIEGPGPVGALCDTATGLMRTAAEALPRL
jgi:eukaryotic-like serine/threonine-protein kinase